jgi:hypothetical protein
MKTYCPDRVTPSAFDLNLDRAVGTATPAKRVIPGEIDLPANTLRGFDAHPGARVLCVRGALWLTQPGDATDHVLAEGETFDVTSRGRVVVQALKSARVRIV